MKLNVACWKYIFMYLLIIFLMLCEEHVFCLLWAFFCYSQYTHNNCSLLLFTSFHTFLLLTSKINKRSEIINILYTNWCENIGFSAFCFYWNWWLLDFIHIIDLNLHCIKYFSLLSLNFQFHKYPFVTSLNEHGTVLWEFGIETSVDGRFTQINAK